MQDRENKKTNQTKKNAFIRFNCQWVDTKLANYDGF